MQHLGAMNHFAFPMLVPLMGQLDNIRPFETFHDSFTNDFQVDFVRIHQNHMVKNQTIS